MQMETHSRVRICFLFMKIKKALTFRASSIGDCLMGKYFLENIHARYPGARLGIVVASRAEMIRDLFTAHPWLEIIEVNRRNPLSIFRLLWSWSGSDVVLTQYAGKAGGRFGLASKFVAHLLARRGGLVGFSDASSWNKYLYDAVLSFERDMAPAKLERQALTKLNIPVALRVPTLSFLPQTSVFERLAVESGRYAIVHLFAGNTGRGLSPKNQRALVSALRERSPGTTLLLSGGKLDREQAERTARGMSDVRVIAGDTSLQDMMELITSANEVVSVDTGMAHITAHLRKPLVVLATCLGLHWWKKEQYGQQAQIQLFTHVEPNGHTFKEYPDCINNVDMQEVARTAL